MPTTEEPAESSSPAQATASGGPPGGDFQATAEPALLYDCADSSSNLKRDEESPSYAGEMEPQRHQAESRSAAQTSIPDSAPRSTGNKLRPECRAASLTSTAPNPERRRSCVQMKGGPISAEQRQALERKPLELQLAKNSRLSRSRTSQRRPRGLRQAYRLESMTNAACLYSFLFEAPENDTQN